jgi:acetoacetyl-CoA synthetase
MLDEHEFESYDEAWRWSVDARTAGAFWAEISRTADVHWYDEPIDVMQRDTASVTGVRWFSGGTLNYAEHALTSRRAGDELALMSSSDTRDRVAMTWDELRDLVARLQEGLRLVGVQKGDIVAAYLPNIPETLALMLATTGLGAVWTCCAPEMGSVGVLDRLAQINPVVLVAVDGYKYGDKSRDVRAEANVIRERLTTLRTAVMLSYLGDTDIDAAWQSWENFVEHDGPLHFEPVPFDHPLYILYSSGTTGKPKAIVHGHGGITLEHVKALHYHFDLDEGDRFFWYSTTGWMMWNFCVSGLLVDATVCLYDGNPGWPSADALWQFIDENRVTCAGVGASFLVANMKASLTPGATFALTDLVTLGVTGSALPPAAAQWIYRDVKSDLLVNSFSGGTDVCTGIVGSSPLHPVIAGEISCRCLGAKVEVFNDDGQPVIDVEGELVVTAPLPSMPVGFLNDPEDRRYRATYFERFPGVWAHGDRATLTSRGTVVITGRSDGTLNRGGVRMGTAEFYSVVEDLEGIADSLVVHLEDRDGGAGEIWLFVVMDPMADVDGLTGRISSALRDQLSPRHIPDRIVVVPTIPRTATGKKLEVPVKKILSGADPASAVTLSSLADPESLAPFLELARTRFGEDSAPA